MKRPLGILAAAIVSLSLSGSMPARAAAPHSPQAPTYASLDRGDDTLFFHHHDDDDDGESRCSGLIAICIG